MSFQLEQFLQLCLKSGVTEARTAFRKLDDLHPESIWKHLNCGPAAIRSELTDILYRSGRNLNTPIKALL